MNGRTYSKLSNRYVYYSNFSQEQLAENPDLSPRYVSDIENGKGKISIDTLETIASVLKVKPYLLIKEQKHRTLPKRVNITKF